MWETSPEQTEATYSVAFPARVIQTVRIVAGADRVSFTISIRDLTSGLFGGVHSNSCLNNSCSVYFEDMERIRSVVWTDEGASPMLEIPIGGKGEPLHGGGGGAEFDGEATPRSEKVRYPLLAIVSRDGEWMIAQAYGAGRSAATNAHYSCLHPRPVWPDIPPGEERSVTGQLYLIHGGPVELFARAGRLPRRAPPMTVPRGSAPGPSCGPR